MHGHVMANYKCQGLASISCARNLECVAFSPPPPGSLSGFRRPSLCPREADVCRQHGLGQGLLWTSAWFQSMTDPWSRSEGPHSSAKSHSSYSVPPWLWLASITTSALALSLELAMTSHCCQPQGCFLASYWFLCSQLYITSFKQFAVTRF